MNARMRYLLAALCAGIAGLLTLFYLGGSSAANEADDEIIWVARQPLPPGVQLQEGFLQRVRVDGPTRRLLVRSVLPSSASDSPDQWFTMAPVAMGEALIPGGNVSQQSGPLTSDGSTVESPRVVTLAAADLSLASPRVGEEVDLYVIPFEGGDAIRILSQTQVLLVEEGMITVLVPESLVAPVLTAAEGSTVKVVRRLQGLIP